MTGRCFRVAGGRGADASCCVTGDPSAAHTVTGRCIRASSERGIDASGCV